MVEFDRMTSDELREMYELKMKEEAIAKYTIPDKPCSDGYYHVRLIDKNGRRSNKQVTARDIPELKEKLYKYEKGIDGSARRTFKEVFELLQESNLECVKNPLDLESKKSTADRNRKDFRRFISGTDLENMYVDDITKKDLDRLIIMNCKRYDLIKSAFNAMRCVLSSTMRFAFEEEMIETNPYMRLRFKKYDQLYFDGADTVDRMFNDIQIQKIKDELEKIHEKRPYQMTAWAVHLELLVNFRPGEAPLLLWEDIHENYFGVCKEQIKTVSGAHLGVNHTKTRYNRRVPLTPRVQKLLDRIKAFQSVYYPNTPYLFPNVDGTDCVKKKAVYDCLHRICERCGIQLSSQARKGSSAFRKAGSSKVQTATNPDFESKIFGHSPEVARKHYLADDGLDMDEAVKILDALGF